MSQSSAMMIFGARPLLAAARQAAASNDVAGPRSAARPPQALAPSRRQKKQGLSASFAVQAKLSKEDRLVGMQLQKQLSSATDVETVLGVTAEHAAELDHIHVSTAFHRAVTASRAPAERQRLLSDARFAALTTQVAFQLPKLDSQGVSNVIWGWSTLAPDRLPPPDLWRRLKESLAKDALWQAAKPQAISNTAWAYARLCQALGEPADAPALLALASRAAGRCGDFKPQELSNLLWALGCASIPEAAAPKALLGELADALLAKRQQCNAQDIGNALWAFGRIGFGEVPEGHLSSLLESLAKLNFDDRALMNSLWGCAALAERVRAGKAQLDAVVAQGESKLSGNARAAAVSLWALARMRHDPGPKFVARAISVIAGKSASLQPIDVAQTLWSSVELGYLPGEKSRKVLLDLVDRDAAALDAQQLNMVAFALSRMKTSSGGEVPDALAQKLFERAKEAVVGKPELTDELKSIKESFKELGLPALA